MGIRPPFVLVCCLALSAFGANGTRAQQRPNEARPPQDTTARDTAARDTVPPPTIRLPPPPLGYDPAVFSLAVTLGRPGGGEAQTQTVRAFRRDLAGTVTDSAALTRTVSVRGAVYGGVSGTLSLSRRWGLRLGLGVATAALEPAYEGEHEVFLASAEAVATAAAELRALTVEGALHYRIPSQKGLQPYVELGIAMSRWTGDGPLPEVAALAAAPTRFEAVAGLGGVVPLTERFSARVHASTRVLRTPVEPVAAGDTVAASSALLLTSRPPTALGFADGTREVLGLLRLEVGLSLDLGGGVARPPDRSAPPDTTLPPGR